MNIFIKILFFIFFTLSVIYYIYKPKYQGTAIHNYEKYGNVNIHREKDYGIPHIQGDSIDSVCFG